MHQNVEEEVSRAETCIYFIKFFIYAEQLVSYSLSLAASFSLLWIWQLYISKKHMWYDKLPGKWYSFSFFQSWTKSFYFSTVFLNQVSIFNEIVKRDIFELCRKLQTSFSVTPFSVFTTGSFSSLMTISYGPLSIKIYLKPVAHLNNYFHSISLLLPVPKPYSNK